MIVVGDMGPLHDLLRINTRFYVGRECRRVIDDVKQRDRDRTLRRV
jgi:hypothetical protein